MHLLDADQPKGRFYPVRPVTIVLMLVLFLLVVALSVVALSVVALLKWDKLY
jgi:hypothetical protein